MSINIKAAHKGITEKSSPKDAKHFNHHSTGYQGKDSREGRLHDVDTTHGKFRFKDNRKGE